MCPDIQPSRPQISDFLRGTECLHLVRFGIGGWHRGVWRPESANVLRHLKTTVLNYGEAIVTSKFKDLKKKKADRKVLWCLKGPLHLTRWAHRVEHEHRDVSPCARESWTHGTPGSLLLGLNIPPHHHFPGMSPGSVDHSWPDHSLQHPGPRTTAAEVGVSVYDLFSSANFKFWDPLCDALRLFVDEHLLWALSQVMDLHTILCE